MQKDNNQCYKCEGESGKDNLVLHGYIICDSCKSKLGLLQDKTIKRHFLSFEKTKKEDPNNQSFEENIHNRLVCLDKDYISKRIKLSHILERLETMKT